LINPYLSNDIIGIFFYMTDFKSFISDFTHLVSGASSVADNMRSEVQENIQTSLHTLIAQAGFVRRDEFDALNDRFEEALIVIKTLQEQINQAGTHKNDS